MHFNGVSFNSGTEKELKKISKNEINIILNTLNNKIKNFELNITCIQKSDFLIHDFWYEKNSENESKLFFVYKFNNFRILLEVNEQILIIHKIFVKKKNKIKYYTSFREYSRKVVS